MQILVLSKEGKRGFSTLWSPIPFPGVARISDGWIGEMARKKPSENDAAFRAKMLFPYLSSSRESPQISLMYVAMLMRVSFIGV